MVVHITFHYLSIEAKFKTVQICITITSPLLKKFILIQNYLEGYCTKKKDNNRTYTPLP